VRVVLVRLDPARVTFDVERRERDDGRPAWAVDSAPGALVALNAGQFAADRPWGWVVREGRELQPPGTGPLSMAFVVDSAGRARLVPADSVGAVRDAGGVRTAFQSYPALLVGDATVPAPLRAGGRGVDVGHRDARLAVGALRDGRLLVALTRFEGLGGALEILPLGPTTPEMAALLGALGARQAVLLDGGLSAQLRLRTPGGVERWPGLRRVPLGLVVTGR
jgi:exopolysaccharide biosynthesis protein